MGEKGRGPPAPGPGPAGENGRVIPPTDGDQGREEEYREREGGRGGLLGPVPVPASELPWNESWDAGRVRTRPAGGPPPKAAADGDRRRALDDSRGRAERSTEARGLGIPDADADTGGGMGEGPGVTEENDVEGDTVPPEALIRLTGRGMPLTRPRRSWTGRCARFRCCFSALIRAVSSDAAPGRAAAVRTVVRLARPCVKDVCTDRTGRGRADIDGVSGVVRPTLACAMRVGVIRGVELRTPPGPDGREGNSASGALDDVEPDVNEEACILCWQAPEAATGSGPGLDSPSSTGDTAGTVSAGVDSGVAGRTLRTANSSVSSASGQCQHKKIHAYTAQGEERDAPEI